jgi:outer membrane biosynthesis protein TonB
MERWCESAPRAVRFNKDIGSFLSVVYPIVQRKLLRRWRIERGIPEPPPLQTKAPRAPPPKKSSVVADPPASKKVEEEIPKRVITEIPPVNEKSTERTNDAIKESPVAEPEEVIKEVNVEEKSTAKETTAEETTAEDGGKGDVRPAEETQEEEGDFSL